MGFEVKIIADSVNEFGNRLTTLEATYPRIILAEVNTHRDRTRSAASSRAIPWAKMSERVANDPFVPIKWGMEQGGMQEGQEIPERMRKLAEDLWHEGLQRVLECAEAIAKIGQVYVDCYPEEAQDGDELVRIHKSIPNRLIEPWMWTTQVMTATEWNNFFRLRCHPDAEVHFQKIAGMMRDARNASTPRQLKTGEWHLPYVLDDELHEDIELLKKVSTARCARVSHLTQDGRRDLSKDVELFDRLCQGSGFGHWCYDKDTEVLTDKGWMRWDCAVEQKPKLAAADPNTGVIQFESPTGWVAAPYSGKMYAVKGHGLDLLVTPNHNLIVSTRMSGGKWTEFRKATAESVFGKPVRHTRSGHLDERERVRTNNTWGYGEQDFAALVGFFCGDGNIEVGSANVLYFNLRLPHKIEYLLSIAPSAERLRSGKWAVRGEGITVWFRNNCYTPCGQKKLPDSFLMATGCEFVGLMSGLRNSDGSAKRNTWSYSTTSLRLAGGVQALLHLNGLAAGWSVRKSTIATQRDCICIHVSDRTSPRVETRHCGRSKTFTEQWVWYEGDVYCATVSTGALLVRRNGVVSISGNSPHEHIAQASTADHRSGPFIGWKQYRKFFANENVPG